MNEHSQDNTGALQPGVKQWVRTAAIAIGVGGGTFYTCPTLLTAISVPVASVTAGKSVCGEIGTLATGVGGRGG